MDQFIWLLIIIVCGVAAIRLYTTKFSGSGSTPLSPQEAKARLDSDQPPTLLDVRTQEEYTAGHIPGALCLPNESITAQSAAALLPDPATEILVYCHSGSRSAMAARKLAKLGYTNVSNLGGIVNWPYEITAE